ncbi:RNA polymerase sigma factor [Chitinophagales bacterium]|nr:RNA polymerase sigma factor [Chitinophagales bacterium]
MSAITFTTSVVDFSSNLKPYAIKLTHDHEQADDLVQETVYRALVNEDKFREGTNLKAWLFTIMKNIFINGYRRRAKRKTVIDTTENLYFINSASPSTITANRSEANFMMDDIQAAIASLTDEYRIPFLMHYKGFKYQEIAEDLDLPLGTVKSRIFFARRDLKAKLSVYESDKNSGEKVN